MDSEKISITFDVFWNYCEHNKRSSLKGGDFCDSFKPDYTVPCDAATCPVWIAFAESHKNHNRRQDYRSLILGMVAGNKKILEAIKEAMPTKESQPKG